MLRFPLISTMNNDTPLACTLGHEAVTLAFRLAHLCTNGRKTAPYVPVVAISWANGAPWATGGLRLGRWDAGMGGIGGGSLHPPLNQRSPNLGTCSELHSAGIWGKSMG